jgi:hypothetical protein
MSATRGSPSSNGRIHAQTLLTYTATPRDPLLRRTILPRSGSGWSKTPDTRRGAVKAKTLLFLKKKKQKDFYLRVPARGKNATQKSRSW